MGYELVEQMGWTYPDAVFYRPEARPWLDWHVEGVRGAGAAGLGLGASAEDDRGAELRVRARGACIRRRRGGVAHVGGRGHLRERLAVPKPYGDSIVLEIARASGGLVVDFPDTVILESLLDWSRHEGLLLSPEGAAATAAYDHLIETGFLKKENRVVLFNTGAGLKYTDLTAEAMGLSRLGKLPERMAVGGIITPQ